MPVIKKQLPPARTPARAPARVGSVLADAIPVGEIDDDYIRMSIYGGNRVGKTSLACEFPKPLLLVAFEPNPTGGARSVKKVPGVVLLRLTSSERGLELCRQLTDTGGRIPADLRQRLGVPGERFMSYVVDGATSYQDVVLREVMGWDKIPEQLAYGMVGKERYQERAEKVKEGLRPFVSLPGHVVVLAKEKDHNPPKDDYGSLHKLNSGTMLIPESFFAEDVGGSVAGWLHDVCDYIGRLYLDHEVKTTTRTRKLPGGKTEEVVEEEDTGKFVRRLRTLYHKNYAAGFRSADPTCVPEYIEGGTPRVMYDKIMKVIQGIKLVGGK